jgi:BirA family biotin operon repressor/biotin-[acetyl-CoA-carboxylase] ligase
VTAPPGQPGTWRLQSFACLASTQDLCRSLAAAGEPADLAILAERQTSGRGRHGRTWESPSGNLSLSVLLRPREPARTAGQWSLLAAVAVAEAIAAHLPAPMVPQLKWPNDVVLGAAKLAGVLTEAAARPDAMLDWLVIGFGVNLAVSPALPDRATTCLADHAAAPSPHRFAAELLDRLAYWRQQRLLGGFAPVRAAWLAMAPQPGSKVALRVPTGTIDGAFAGLGEDGSLLLSTDGQVRAFATGES